jgi:glycosyltransferase involved in cell wall biosynthesis
VKIAAVYDPELVNAQYRSLVPMAALRRRGHDVTFFPQVNGEPALSIAQLARYDVVHVHRLVINEDDTYVEQLHDAGVAVCFDNDDDARSVAPEMWRTLEDEVDPASIQLVLDEYERTVALLPQMDLVTTPSAVLAERFRAAGARDVRVLDNYISREFLRIRPFGRPGFIVGWHGGREHRWDADALGMRDVLRRVLEAHEHVHVVTIGLDLGLDSNRYEFCEWLPLLELSSHLVDFAIGIAPLADNAFTQGRSAVKVREYAAAGVPWLASPVGSYRGLGKAEGGRLVGDEEWFEALDALIRSPIERALLRRRGKSWTRRELIQQTVHLWDEAFRDVVDAGRRAAA